MPSVFSQLYRFARSAEKSALENFTTEALAAAIRVDAGPFVDALIQAEALLPDMSEAKAKVVETQVSVGRGILDLVVELESAAGRDLLWIEVKAHAGLSGDGQLSLYGDAAANYPVEPRPRVIMLCKRSLTDVPTLRWNVLGEAILAAGDRADRYWRELRAFLEEHRMADEYDTPITTGELDAAAAGRSLMRKATRLAHEFLAMMRKDAKDGAWRECGFPSTERKVEAAVARQFQRHGRLVTASKRYPHVCFGITFVGRPRLEVWVEFRPKDMDAREAVFAAAKAGGLSEDGWSFEASGWPSIRAGVDADVAATQEDALKWLRERFEELERARVFAEIGKWRWKDREARQESNA